MTAGSSLRKKYVAANHGKKHCHRVIEHNNEYYIGALMLITPNSAGWLPLLQYHHIGRSNKEIGDLDFRTLSNSTTCRVH